MGIHPLDKRRLMYYEGEDLFVELFSFKDFKHFAKAGWIDVSDDPVFEQLYQLFIIKGIP